MPKNYQPPFTITSKIIRLISEVSEQLGRMEVLQQGQDLRLRRINRIRTIQGSLAIEGNTLTEDQITAILEGKLVIAPPRDVQEARNAINAYDMFEQWQPAKEGHLLNAHFTLMAGLIDDAGTYRSGNVGVMNGDAVVHMAPPASQVKRLMTELLGWLKQTDLHPLIASCVFHYEFEFIHPFSDGNGRMGRLWQTLILSQWQPLLAQLPVESLVFAHQSDYYRAINASTKATDSAPFIEFMLQVIQEALQVGGSETPQGSPHATPHVTPHVKVLLEQLALSKTPLLRDQLQEGLGLRDRKSFRERYLKPALEARFIEMTQPDRPRSRSQQYRLTPAGRDILG